MKNQNASEIPTCIQKILREREMTLAEIAAAVGVSFPTIYRWQKISWWQRDGKRMRRCHAKYAVERLRALASGQGDAQYLPVVGERSIISINLQIDPLNLDDQALKKIRAVKAVLATLETLATQQ